LNPSIKPLVSVVIIGRNEGLRLRCCLESVVRIERRGFETEVIYVDSGSTDHSVALAMRMGARIVALTPKRPSAALARNAGWKAAHGSFVMFLDGDTVIDPAFVAEALPSFASPQVAIVWGHRREMRTRGSVYNRALDLDWVYAPGPAQFCGGDALFRTDVLRITGGFDKTLIAGEEPELCRRILALGLEILHVDLPMTGHDLGMTEWTQYWRRATRAGHAYAEVAERFAGTDDPFWTAEVRRNRIKAVVLQGVLAGMLAGAVLSWTVWPLLGVLVLLTLLVVRTAWKARWKSKNWTTLLLYGVHSHLQQIPIFWGQVEYRRNRRRGKRAMLLEYKKP
jgi:cellulose synthase/poly-beta-1,6-N-acetylglucosamine synthase-like glycosyltransferase